MKEKEKKKKKMGNICSIGKHGMESN